MDEEHRSPSPSSSDDDDSETEEDHHDNDDMDYEPEEWEFQDAQEEEDLDTSGSWEELDRETDVLKQPKFIVFLSSLLQLISWCHCPSCGSLDFGSSGQSVKGSRLSLLFRCHACDYEPQWHSQPTIGARMPAGNLLISAGILVAGASATKVLRVLQHIRVATIGMRTFIRHQARFLQPSVMRVWASQQADMISKLKDSGRLLCMGGDGRAKVSGLLLLACALSFVTRRGFSSLR